MKFLETQTWACVSTGYLEESDLVLISQADAPGKTAEHVRGYGSYFYVPDKVSVPDTEWLEYYEQELRDFGLSERFLEIVRLARESDIQYINFDRDGGYIQGMDSCG